MIHKDNVVIRALVNAHYFGGRGLTAGECAKKTHIPKSTVRRMLQKLANEGYATLEIEKYKSTGKRVFYITEEGRLWLADYRKEIENAVF